MSINQRWPPLGKQQSKTILGLFLVSGTSPASQNSSYQISDLWSAACQRASNGTLLKRILVSVRLAPRWTHSGSWASVSRTLRQGSAYKLFSSIAFLTSTAGARIIKRKYGLVAAALAQLLRVPLGFLSWTLLLDTRSTCQSSENSLRPGCPNPPSPPGIGKQKRAPLGVGFLLATVFKYQLSHTKICPRRTGEK